MNPLCVAMMRQLRTCMSIVPLCLILTACAGFKPQQGPGEEPEGRYTVLTEPIIAIGDTQEHEATSIPLVDNDNALDAYIDVTQRPPEQPLFGRRIMEWVFKAHPDSAYLHLGDVLDLSCQSEAQRMQHLFKAAPPRGALLPGNHDGLMFGIYGYDVLGAATDEGARKWNTACRRGIEGDDTPVSTDAVQSRPESAEAGKGSRRAALTKRDFIALYVEGLRADPKRFPGLSRVAQHGIQRISWRHPDKESYLGGIEAVLIEGPLYADSFIAQRLKLPAAPGATRGVVVIALDTNQAGPLVHTWDVLRGRSPGSRGHVRPDQVLAVRKWVTEAVRAGDLVVFAGHHNWGSLGQTSRLLLGGLMSMLPHPLAYLSAHTHRGFWAVHRVAIDRPLLELNTSSLSDWPIAYRRIDFSYDEKAQRLRVRGDLMPAGEQAHASDKDLLAAWQREACERSGVDPAELARLDADLVDRQHASRGSLLTFLRAKLQSDCEACDADRYQRAGEYQNQMLEVLLETGRQVAAAEHRLDQVRLPAFCEGQSWEDCAQRLMAQQAEGAAGWLALYRRKARLVDLLSNHLDRVDEPRARAYMTCRAVLAAKQDFERSTDDSNSDRAEWKRRAEQFFRTEASIGVR